MPGIAIVHIASAPPEHLILWRALWLWILKCAQKGHISNAQRHGCFLRWRPLNPEQQGFQRHAWGCCGFTGTTGANERQIAPNAGSGLLPDGFNGRSNSRRSEKRVESPAVDCAGDATGA